MTTEELISAQFYAWEKRGRGWQIWNSAVELEPPFQEFLGYYLSSADDGRQHTVISSFVDKLHGKKAIPPSTERSEFERLIEIYDENEPAPFPDDRPLKEIQLSLPTKGNANREVAERFISSLRTAKMPIGFEIIGLSDSIVMQFVCRECDLSLLKSNLKAYFPDSRVQESNNYLTNNWSNLCEGEEVPILVDFGLSHEFVIPLHTNANFSIDSLTGIVGTLADVQNGEMAVLQVLFQATQHDWANNALKATTNRSNDSVLGNAPHIVEQLRQKLSQLLFAAVIRVGTISKSTERSWELAKRLGTALISINQTTANPNTNELIPLSNDGYEHLWHEKDFLLRQTHRSGMILNSAELLTLVHIPPASLRSEKFSDASRITKAAPPIAMHDQSKGVVMLGENIHEGSMRHVSLTNEQRSKHIHIIGSTGSGKSTLMLGLVKQDLENGNGLVVLDPHGDLIDEVIANVPDHRTDDVILFDPSDAEYPIGFNILQANSELEKTLLSSDLNATFRRMSTSWGDVMDSVLANAILAFVESTRGGTLFDLKRFLVEKNFRTEFLQTVTDETIRYFWQNEFPLIGSKAPSSILIRLDAFLRQKLIRNIFCQKQTTLDFRKVMDEKKVLLIKLSHGLIGEDNAYLLGTLLISKLYQTALSRQDSTERQFFACYLDEFHHFVTPSMENILSGVRKYNLGLVLAHQEFRQLQSRSYEVADSVLSNCYTRICFRLGDTDAEKFASGFSSFNTKTLQSLGVGEAIARIERPDFDFNLSTLLPAETPQEIVNNKLAETVRNTRKWYAKSRSEVEGELDSSFAHPKAMTRNDARSSSGAVVNQDEPDRPARRLKKQNLKPRVEIGVDRDKEALVPPDLPKTEILSAPESQQHRYIQSLIKRIGESKGFIATIEKELFGGAGRIDVLLESERGNLACEVSVTNESSYEVQNIVKCLSAGHDPIVIIAPSPNHLAKIQRSARERLRDADFEKIGFFTPEEFHVWLEAFVGDDEKSSEKVKGFDVKVKLKPIDEAERLVRKKAISEVFFGALRKLGKKGKDT